MATIDDILTPLKPKDDKLGYKPVAEWQRTGEQAGVGGGTADHSGEAGSTVAGRTGEQAAPAFSIADYIANNSPYRPRTEEEMEAERKRRHRDAVFAAVGDGLNAFHQAYANARGVKPMTEDKSRAKDLRDRWEKEDDKDEARRMQRLNYYIKLKQMDEEAERDARNFEYKKERDKAADEKDKNDRAFKERAFEYQKDRDTISDQFKQQDIDFRKENAREAIRQFNVSSGLQQQRINMEAKRLAKAMEGNEVTFALGRGNGNVSVPKAALNGSNIAYVFSKLPEEVRETVKGKPIYNKTRPNQIDGYEPVSGEAMLVAIGANIENCPEAQEALKQIGGKVSSGGNSNKYDEYKVKYDKYKVKYDKYKVK